MPPSDARSPRRGRRALGGPSLEPLERREVLSYSALGYSLPDLTVQAYSGLNTAWGGTLAVTADIFNIGSSTMVEPFNQAQAGYVPPFASAQNPPTASTQLPNAISHADAGPTTLEVVASPHPRGGDYVVLGSVAVPAIPQNSFVGGTVDLNLPARPAGFTQFGRIYLTYIINPFRNVIEATYANNAFVQRQPVQLEPTLPDLQVVGFNVPSPLVPGATVIPAIQVANLGTTPTKAQGPVTVQIVASTTRNFGPADRVLATYTVSDIRPLSEVATTSYALGSANLQPTSNIVTLDSLPVVLPSSPRIYYLGVKIDPKGTLRQIGKHVSSRLDAFVKIGPPIPGLLPPGLLATVGSSSGTVPVIMFPYPLAGASGAGGTPLTSASTTTSSSSTPSSGPSLSS